MVKRSDRASQALKVIELVDTLSKPVISCSQVKEAKIRAAQGWFYHLKFKLSNISNWSVLIMSREVIKKELQLHIKKRMLKVNNEVKTQELNNCKSLARMEGYLLIGSVKELER